MRVLQAVVLIKIFDDIFKSGESPAGLLCKSVVNKNSERVHFDIFLPTSLCTFKVEAQYNKLNMS